MNDEIIIGRNFIVSGRFDKDWKKSWKPEGASGFATFEDPDYGNYLMVNSQKVIPQEFTTATFTLAQMPGAKYRVRFQYENYGNHPNSKVVFKTEAGVTRAIQLSGQGIAGDVTGENAVLANWNHHNYQEFDTVVDTDGTIILEVHGADAGGSQGLRLTDVEVDLLLVDLQVTKIHLDNKVYEGQTRVNV